MPDEIASLDTQEERKVTELRIAQSKTEQLFHEVEARGLIRAGIAESQLNQKIYDLAKEMYGISTYWHKRIVRAGALAAGSGVCAILVIFRSSSPNVRQSPNNSTSYSFRDSKHSAGLSRSRTKRLHCEGEPN